MQTPNITPRQVSAEYEAGLRFNRGIDLYESVQTNENFFIGRQWEGVRSNGLPTPVFNFLKRVVLFSVANVAADKLKLRAKPLRAGSPCGERTLETVTGILNDSFDAVFEFSDLGGIIREFCRNAAVDGDGCTYTYWDAAAEGGRGAIRTEVLQNTQVLFGNPNSRDVQSQPYLLIERRVPVEEARSRARRRGGQADRIQPDSPAEGDARLDGLGGEKVTVLLRLWRDGARGTVHAFECTREAVVSPVWDLGIDLYPVTWMSWDYVQDCYHGQAMITGLIPNQIFVNKLFAMSMISLMTLAYPKIIYDKTRVAKWSSRVGAQIAVNGSVDGVARVLDPASVSPQISQFIELAVGYTQKFLGATDAALGDVRPDNSSAIIALQRAAAVPMELTRQELLRSLEELGRIYMAFMAAYYGTRPAEIRVPFTGAQQTVMFDFGVLRQLPFAVELDVGASSYWSEIAAMQTLDNLLLQGRISTVEYLKRLPAGQITDREALIAVLERSGAAEPALPDGIIMQESEVRL